MEDAADAVFVEDAVPLRAVERRLDQRIGKIAKQPLVIGERIFGDRGAVAHRGRGADPVMDAVCYKPGLDAVEVSIDGAAAEQKPGSERSKDADRCANALRSYAHVRDARRRRFPPEGVLGDWLGDWLGDLLGDLSCALPGAVAARSTRTTGRMITVAS